LKGKRILRERERERPTDQTKKNWRVLDRMSFSASVSPVVVKGRTSLGEINGKDSLDGGISVGCLCNNRLDLKEQKLTPPHSTDN
jgi:hypothetical protein